ncbi:hypothetical protein G5714_018266 [Onychostoma macrolepis]|uniref:SRCR domain-containing protein n=1 Tax=Onychostoma macrolepis TaxID=369639 RepID=A0A7J6BYP1_9TELE|nr:hypothetical protein G5714_018266 [Onychostoma macrolepis]
MGGALVLPRAPHENVNTRYDSLISTEPPEVRVNVKLVSQADQRSGSCSWTLSTSSVLAVEDINRLSAQICLSLGCGDVYKLRTYDVEFNSTCLTGCLYHDSELRNCSQTVRSRCTMLSEVICGSPFVAQISSPCFWTIKSPDPKSSVSLPEDAVHSVSHEICHELGCGQVYSLSQNRAGLDTTCFSNCVYHNYQLKNCSEVINSSCSVLSEVKCGNAAVRLEGGDLWQCSELINIPHLCKDDKAAGLICNNSLGLPVPTSPQPTSEPATTVTATMAKPPGFFLSSEQLGCFVLGFLLLIAVITNILLCHHDKKKKAAVAQKRYMNLQAPAEAEENNYRDSVHLVKVTNNSSDAEVPVSPQRIWAQSSVESGSYDTDYEQHDISPETSFPLSTFQNSMRYSADGKRPAVKGTNLNCVMEEAVPAEVTVGGYQRISDHNAQQMRGSATSVDSFESSCTSSGECYENTGTNAQDLCSQESAECYENTGEDRDHLQTADNADFLNQGSGRSFLAPTTDPDFNYQELDKEGGSREDSPLYSPVSYDNEAVSSESGDMGVSDWSGGAMGVSGWSDGAMGACRHADGVAGQTPRLFVIE